MASALVKHPASTAGLACLLLLTAFFWASGALWPSELPAYAHSSPQVIGMTLMLIFIPSYFLAVAIVATRRSLELVDQLEPLLPDRGRAHDARQAIRDGLKRTWPFGAVVGLAAGLSNTQPIQVLRESSTPALDGSIYFGQLLLWLIIGLFFGQRVMAARAFSRLGEAVDVDFFQLDRLRPLARSGMIDVLVIAGALAFSPLQSLDAEFRWYNYSFALMVSIPSGFFLLFWPLRVAHRRIRSEKQRQLARVDGLIAGANRETAENEVMRLESLLAHRDRILNQPTWPLDTGLFSRLFAYLIIPPLAWVGAALVEMLVSRLVG